MTIEAVCFDLDDTLYPYQQYAETGLRSAADLLESRTGKRFHDELATLYFEDGVTDGTFDRLFERHDIDRRLIEPAIDAFHGSSERLVPYDDAEGMLSQLRTNHRLGLITDGRGGHRKLRRLDIREYFDSVLVTPNHNSSKHDPAVFEHVLGELSVQPQAAAYVADDPRVDFRAPNNLEMTTIRIRRGRYVDLEPAESQAAPDREIDDLGALLELL
jgi:putative hydrolase of the HAD superfamily